MQGDDTNPPTRLDGVRVLAALNGLELYGHERGNIEVFKALRDRGAEVVVGTNAAADNHVDVELRRLGFETFALPFSNQWSLQWLRKYPLSIGEKISAVATCSRIFAREARRVRPTHVHLGSALAYSYVSLALVVMRTPLVLRMGDCPPFESRFNLWLWRRAVKRSSKSVAISNFVMSRAREAGARDSEISVIYNLAPSRGPGNSLPTELAGPRDEGRIVYVGAIAEHKGLLQLIDAFARLASRMPLLKLDLVGGSRYDVAFRDRLKIILRESGLSERVRFHGHMPDPSGMYAHAGLHVAPSICEEAAGNVVLEAKVAGTPSVVFPSGGLPEMVRHEIDGFICRERSAEALAEGLCWCLADSVRLRALSAAASSDAEARFGARRFSDAWAAVYAR